MCKPHSKRQFLMHEDGCFETFTLTTWLLLAFPKYNFAIKQGAELELERILHHISIPCVHWCDFSDIKSEQVWKLEVA